MILVVKHTRWFGESCCLLDRICGEWETKVEHFKMFNIVSDDEDPVAHGIMALPSGKIFASGKFLKLYREVS